MKFAKIRDVKSPCRGTKKSAGIDFFVPSYSEDFLKVFQEKIPLVQMIMKAFMLDLILEF